MRLAALLVLAAAPTIQLDPMSGLGFVSHGQEIGRYYNDDGGLRCVYRGEAFIEYHETCFEEIAAHCRSAIESRVREGPWEPWLGCAPSLVCRNRSHMIYRGNG